MEGALVELEQFPFLEVEATRTATRTCEGHSFLRSWSVTSHFDWVGRHYESATSRHFAPNVDRPPSERAIRLMSCAPNLAAEST